jgi:hypothetical protein
MVIDDLEFAPFNVFVDWLYTGKIPRSPKEWLLQFEVISGSALNMDDDQDESGSLCLETYVVADRLGVQELLKAINKRFVDSQAECSPWYGSVIYALKNIPAERLILKFVMGAHCAYARNQDEVDLREENALETQLPSGFLLPVMKRYRHMLGKQPELLRPCDYYEH